jgi:putative MFS transporter
MNTETIRIDDLPLGKFHYKVIALTFGAHLTDGYILGLIGIAFTLLTPAMALDSFWQGVIGSSVLLGLFFGSMLAGVISDRFGRQKIFLFSFVIIVLGSFLQYFAMTPLTLALCRVFIGIGIGGDYSVGHALLAEFCPKKHRGAILGSFSVIWTLGYVAATFIGTAMIKADLGPDTWRLMLASSLVPALIVLIARRGFPESPRWLMNKGREKESAEVLKRHLGEHVILGDETIDHSHSGFRALFTRKYIKRTVFNCLFFVCIVIPYFAIYTFLPMILGIMNLSEGFGTELMLNVMLILGALLGIWCTIRFTRRGFLIGAFAILTAVLFVFSILSSDRHVLLIMLFALFTLTLSAVSNLVGVFPAESFPTEVRSSGIGFATAISRLGSAISTFLLPVFLSDYGVNTTMLIMAVVLLVGTVVSVLWAPETKTLSLAQAGKVVAA